VHVDSGRHDLVDPVEHVAAQAYVDSSQQVLQSEERLKVLASWAQPAAVGG
jgi:hypothetical protein